MGIGRATKHALRAFLAISLLVLVLCTSPPTLLAEVHPSTITFENQSGKLALVKLIGPTAQAVEVPNGQSGTVNAAAGKYYILVRYGAEPAVYRYTKGDPFSVTETATQYSVIRITLHPVVGGDYVTHPTSAEEFDKVVLVPELSKIKVEPVQVPGLKIFKPAKIPELKIQEPIQVPEVLGPSKTPEIKVPELKIKEPTPILIRIPGPERIAETKIPEELVNTIGMKFRLVQPGSFMMGSEKGDDDEKPVHKVTLTKGFYMGVYEVTQEEWEKVMGSNPSRFKGPKNPVENVSWEDAQEFIHKLSEKENMTYRLPTEAEWEYACRAGTTTRFYWGDDPQYREIGDSAWYTFNSGNRTHPVGQKKPNPWGLYDMSGNVWEWCRDWYSTCPSGSQTDPTGSAVGYCRVLRGGGWLSLTTGCRSALRTGRSPSSRYVLVGFRLVSTLSESTARDDKDASKMTPRPPVALDAGPAVSGPATTLPGAQREELVNTIGTKFRLIQPGSFMMGSDKGNEKPVHRVTLTKGFYIGVYEVTQEEWEKVMGSNPSEFKGPKNPVENVSWEDAQEFVRKLSEKEKATYRLPTEAEWEYACRAGTTTAYYWGDGFDGRYAWNEGNSGGKTQPVGTRQPNAWGLYDMSGNVFEWCKDWRGEYPSDSQTDPTGPPDESHRGQRGGCWFGSELLCRSAFRGLWISPDSQVGFVGFRLVRENH